MTAAWYISGVGESALNDGEGPRGPAREGLKPSSSVAVLAVVLGLNEHENSLVEWLVPG